MDCSGATTINMPPATIFVDGKEKQSQNVPLEDNLKVPVQINLYRTGYEGAYFHHVLTEKELVGTYTLDSTNNWTLKVNGLKEHLTKIAVKKYGKILLERV